MHNHLSIWTRWASALLMVGLLLLPTFASAHVMVILPPDVLKDYLDFLKGRDPLTITDYSGPLSRRDVVEVVLFQQALDLGGFDMPLKLRTVASYSRTMLELQTGAAAAAANTMWHRDLIGLDANILISPALVRKGSSRPDCTLRPETSGRSRHHA